VSRSRFQLPSTRQPLLIICISITWGVLQERITTTNYGTEKQREVFKYPVVMNTVQSTFAAMFGYIYVLVSRKSSSDLPVFPTRRIIWPLTLVALTSALSSPFGYASLQHVDYITFILAKSCKLLPVMFLHVTLYRKKYPFYKYAVVALVTTGVAVFTLHQPAGSKKKGASGNSLYGLMLLGINLLFDGLTNSTQDDIYASFRPYTGQQMMCALNVISTCITTVYLLLSPYLAQTWIGSYFGVDLKSSGELQDALAFIQRHPTVGWDIVGFAFCGAVGQLFICESLKEKVSLLTARFGIVFGLTLD
jgi:solute carrier family 35 (UDP-galactose transporter), member B1